MTRAPVLAVVVASRGDEALSRSLDSVAWAAERAVIDPAGRIPPRPLADGVRLAQGLARLDSLGSAPWILLLREGEEATPAIAAAVTAVVSGSSTPRRMRRELRTLGEVLLLRRGLVRLAPRIGTRLRLTVALELELGGRSTAAATALGPPLLEQGAPSLERAVAVLDAESSGLAAMLELTGARPRLRHLLGAPLAAGMRVLTATSAEPVGLGRWIVAVLAGYRAIVTHAKLWERRRSRPLELRGEPLAVPRSEA